MYMYISISIVAVSLTSLVADLLADNRCKRGLRGVSARAFVSSRDELRRRRPRWRKSIGRLECRGDRVSRSDHANAIISGDGRELG